MEKRQPAILVVDDEPDMVRGLQRLLSLDRYHVETAGSIAEMMDRPDWSNFFAILLDRKLPDGYAEDILPELKILAPDAAVIIITGHSDLQSTITSFRAGAADYLLKPIDPEVLRDRLRRVNELRLAHEALRREEAERKTLQKEVLNIATEEQRRIGQDLHDSIGQRLTGIGYVAQTLLERLSTASQALDEAEVGALRDMATKLSEGIGTTFEELHTIVQGLVPVQIGSRGLMDALDELAKVTDALQGVACSFKCEKPVEVLDTTTATHLYRIAQEAVGNALKHGRPATILLTLEADKRGLRLEVADDGTGVDRAEKRSSMGLKIMRYRAGMIGATLAIETAEGGGTVVRCQCYGGGGVKHEPSP